ncbi:hypothetical protein BX600DRAFT_430978 [Xylariales sp. PMI_506]|nr:hypothetical protein BX600DRAFT_430978 [Xylariales sp. PMI_506]
MGWVLQNPHWEQDVSTASHEVLARFGGHQMNEVVLATTVYSSKPRQASDWVHSSVALASYICADGRCSLASRSLNAIHVCPKWPKYLPVTHNWALPMPCTMGDLQDLTPRYRPRGLIPPLLRADCEATVCPGMIGDERSPRSPARAAMQPYFGTYMVDPRAEKNFAIL